MQEGGQEGVTLPVGVSEMCVCLCTRVYVCEEGSQCCQDGVGTLARASGVFYFSWLGNYYIGVLSSLLFFCIFSCVVLCSGVGFLLIWRGREGGGKGVWPCLVFVFALFHLRFLSFLCLARLSTSSTFSFPLSPPLHFSPSLLVSLYLAVSFSLVHLPSLLPYPFPELIYPLSSIPVSFPLSLHFLLIL